MFLVGPGSSSGLSMRGFLGALFAIGVLVCCVPTLLALAGDYRWYLDVWSHFRPYYVATLAPAVLILLARRSFRIAVLPLVCLAYNLSFIVPLYVVPPEAEGAPQDARGDDHRARIDIGVSRRDGGDGAGALESARETDAGARRLPSRFRVLVMNVFALNEDHERALAEVRRVDADLVAILESDATWLEALAPPLAEEYPHWVAEPATLAYGISVFSRLPVEGLEVGDFGLGWPSIRGDVIVGSTRVHLAVTHPPPPIRRRNWVNHRRCLRGIEKLARSVSGPLLVMGDLNDAGSSTSFRRLLANTTLRDSRRGFGLQFSWRGGRSLVHISIDHVLVSPHFRVLDRRIGRDIGSDHLPVICDLEVVAPPSSH